MALERLTALISPAQQARSDLPDWARVEEALGVGLPEDYRELILAYGPGSFDGFLWVLQPDYENAHLDLVAQSSVRLDALRIMDDAGEHVLHSLARDRPGILPWAFTDNGDVCFWIVEPREKPDTWRVTVNESRSNDWEEFDGSATEFLLAVFDGSYRGAIFPDDFPSEEPGFHALHM